jgi:hypothetical protein
MVEKVPALTTSCNPQIVNRDKNTIFQLEIIKKWLNVNLIYGTSMRRESALRCE